MAPSMYLHRLILLLALATTILPLSGQETPKGIVAYKKSPSHPDQNAKIQTFRSYEYSDPRYLFFTGTGSIEVTRFQGPAIYLLQNVENENRIPPAQLLGLEAQLSAAEAFSNRFKKAAPLLKSEIIEIEETIKRLKLGQQKIDGLWLNRDDAKIYLFRKNPAKIATTRLSALQNEIFRERQRLADAKRSAALARNNLRLLEMALDELKEKKSEKR